MASYYDTAPGATTRDPRIYLQVEIGDGQVDILAMVDTAAPWCIVEPSLARALKADLEEPEQRVAILKQIVAMLG